MDTNTIEGAIAHFECRYTHEQDQSEIFYKGVFGIKEDHITVQYFGYIEGMHFLVEKRGKVLSNTSFELTEYNDYFTDSTIVINEKYQFKAFSPLRNSESFISRHPKRFGRKKPKNEGS